jgi:hypothetical protein
VFSGEQSVRESLRFYSTKETGADRRCAYNWNSVVSAIVKFCRSHQYIRKDSRKSVEHERLVNKVIVKVPHPVAPPSRFELLQQWEGEVRQVDSDEFTAVVRDITNSRSPEEEVTLPKDEVSRADLELVQPGAIFYWIIGYRVSRGGQKTRTSDLRFRRLPAWTSKEIKRARERALEIERLLGIG